jgi:hypothetical protein
MSISRAVRLLLLPVTAAVLLLPAAPAVAAGGITSPGAGEVVTADAVLPLRAVVEGPVTGPSELTLTEPGSDVEQVVAVSTSPGGGELAYDFDTSCADSVCAQRSPARNGSWLLRLRGSASDERTFDLRIPPAAPVELTAEPVGGGVLLQWRRGAEPDLTGYAVEDAQGALVRGGIGLDACDASGRCRAEVPSEAGAWAVRAYRQVCPDCVTTLRSSRSETVALQAAADSPVDVAVPAPASEPPPEESRPPLRDQRSAFAQAFGAGRPAVGELPRGAAPAGPPAAQPDGAYDLELGYDAPQAGSAPGRESVGEALSALGSADRVRLTLVSGLLIGGALWLRRWARRVIAD